MGNSNLKRYLFDSDQVEEDLFKLMSIFHASSKNQSVLEPLVDVGKILGYLGHEEGIIQKTLISTAITLRMIDDRFNYNSQKQNLHHSSVGCLQIKKQTLQLSFREACNKIVHATEFYLNTRKTKVTNTEYLDGFVTAKGIQGKESWTAEIEIEKYVIDGLCLIKLYDENWEVSSR